MDMVPVDMPIDLTTAETFLLGADLISVLTSCAHTGGDIYAVLVRMPPGGGPPVMHRHEPSEVYHVLKGEFAFYVGHPDHDVVRVVVRAGQVMPLAGGTPHTIRNETDRDAVAFSVHTPGEVMEGFTRAVVAVSADGPPAIEAVLAIAEQHGIEMLGPVPADVRHAAPA